MKALTLRPKWAHAICYEGKDVENRSWRPTVEEGELLAIHAGCARTREERDQYVCGAIVAVVMVGAPRKNVRSPWSKPGDWQIPIYEVEILDRPIKCQGRLGLWSAEI
jgi:hypothetical protein